MSVHTITPINAREVLVTINEDIARGRTLAESLQGRWSRAEVGHYMTTAKAAKWAQLFEAGYFATKKRKGGWYVWGYRKPDGPVLTLTQALAQRPVMIEEI